MLVFCLRYLVSDPYTLAVALLATITLFLFSRLSRG